MNLDDFLNDAEKTQEMSKAYQNKKHQEKLDAQRKRVSQWDRVREVLPKLENDFAMFQDVSLNGIYECSQPYNWTLYRVMPRKKTFKIGKPEKPEYSGYSSDHYTFESRQGNFCANINFLNDGYIDDRNKIMVQVQLNPKTDTMQYLFTSEYRTYDQVSQYLNIPENEGYKEKVFNKYSRLFDSYEELKEFITDFLKKTVDTDSLKKKHYEQKILELKRK